MKFYRATHCSYRYRVFDCQCNFRATLLCNLKLNQTWKWAPCVCLTFDFLDNRSSPSHSETRTKGRAGSRGTCLVTYILQSMVVTENAASSNIGGYSRPGPRRVTTALINIILVDSTSAQYIVLQQGDIDMKWITIPETWQVHSVHESLLVS